MPGPNISSYQGPACIHKIKRRKVMAGPIEEEMWASLFPFHLSLCVGHGMFKDRPTQRKNKRKKETTRRLIHLSTANFFVFCGGGWMSQTEVVSLCPHIRGASALVAECLAPQCRWTKSFLSLFLCAWDSPLSISWSHATRKKREKEWRTACGCHEVTCL